MLSLLSSLRDIEEFMPTRLRTRFLEAVLAATLNVEELLSISGHVDALLIHWARDSCDFFMDSGQPTADESKLATSTTFTT